MHEVSSSQIVDHHGSGAKNNAALAWFACAFCVSTAGARWLSPEGTFGDGLFALTLGGGVAILAFTLRRRLLYAMRFCRRVAFVTGMVNGFLLHVILTTFIVGLLASPVGSLAELPRDTFDRLLISTLATFAPWAVYWTLREERLRAWCATHTPLV